MAHYLADPQLRMSDQSLAILAMLSQQEPSFARYDKDLHEYEIEVQTSAWYNGRERGVCLVVRRTLSDKRCLIVTFGEHRNSDSIFVDAWEHEGSFLNPPTVEDFPAEAYNRRKYIDYGRVDLAVKHIVETISSFYEKCVVQNSPTRVLDQLGEDS